MLVYEEFIEALEAFLSQQNVNNDILWRKALFFHPIEGKRCYLESLGNIQEIPLSLISSALGRGIPENGVEDFLSDEKSLQCIETNVNDSESLITKGFKDSKDGLIKLDGATSMPIHNSFSELLSSNASKQTPSVPLLFDFHVIYSESYQVPVLFLRSRFEDGRELELKDVLRVLRIDEQSRLSNGGLEILQVQDHPFFRRPWILLHPCQTEVTMKFLLDSESKFVPSSSINNPNDSDNESGILDLDSLSSEQWEGEKGKEKVEAMSTSYDSLLKEELIENYHFPYNSLQKASYLTRYISIWLDLVGSVVWKRWTKS